MTIVWRKKDKSEKWGKSNIWNISNINFSSNDCHGHTLDPRRLKLSEILHGHGLYNPWKFEPSSTNSVAMTIVLRKYKKSENGEKSNIWDNISKINFLSNPQCPILFLMDSKPVCH